MDEEPTRRRWIKSGLTYLVALPIAAMLARCTGEVSNVIAQGAATAQIERQHRP